MIVPPSLDFLLPLMGFAAVSTVTPGPNNLMLTASGLNFGLRRSLPHLFGVWLGFPVMVLLVGVGLAGLFTRSPLLHQGLKLAGTAYILYLAFRIARQSPTPSPTLPSNARPLRFWQAVAFQWVNPKAWVMAVGGTASYTTLAGTNFVEGCLISLTFLTVGLPSAFLWTGAGVAVRRWMSDPRHVRAFNIAMAVLLVASLLPMLRD